MRNHVIIKTNYDAGGAEVSRRLATGEGQIIITLLTAEELRAAHMIVLDEAHFDQTEVSGDTYRRGNNQDFLRRMAETDCGPPPMHSAGKTKAQWKTERRGRRS